MLKTILMPWDTHPYINIWPILQSTLYNNKHDDGDDSGTSGSHPTISRVFWKGLGASLELVRVICTELEKRSRDDTCPHEIRSIWVGHHDHVRLHSPTIIGFTYIYRSVRPADIGLGSSSHPPPSLPLSIHLAPATTSSGVTGGATREKAWSEILSRQYLDIASWASARPIWCEK